jgi:hypothetical protein
MEITRLSSQPAAALTAPRPAAAACCASCDTPLVGGYCHECGEKRLHRHDYALKHFLEHTLDTVTHFDLRVLRDLWLQLRRPGFLAAEWLVGRRVRHAPPVQLFLITNLLFYLLASASHFSPFETKLKYHGPFAQQLVQQHLARTGTAYADFAAHFNNLAHTYSKSLVFLFIPLLLAPLWLLFWRQRRYFVEWVMLSTYLFSGILLLFALMALLALLVHVAPPLLPFFSKDEIVGPVMLLLTVSYVAFFFKKAFPEQATLLRWGKSALFSLAFVAVLMVPYRFILFLACYWAAR